MLPLSTPRLLLEELPLAVKATSDGETAPAVLLWPLPGPRGPPCFPQSELWVSWGASVLGRGHQNQGVGGHKACGGSSEKQPELEQQGGSRQRLCGAAPGASPVPGRAGPCRSVIGWELAVISGGARWQGAGGQGLGDPPPGAFPGRWGKEA